jgi:DNA-binding HxlR family transcriptional regulator
MQEGTQLDLGHIHVTGGCKRITPILARIGDKWTLLIVSILANGPMRFGELKRRINGISQRMLTFSLRGLERNGLVLRTVYPSVPPHVEYELTELGRSLLEPIRHLMTWVGENVDCVEAAQQQYDARNDD